jgi:hypothetical protein
MCVQGTGTIVHTRPALPEDTAWTIGGDAETDMVGRSLVVHDQGGNSIGCGLITRAH